MATEFMICGGGDLGSIELSDPQDKMKVEEITKKCEGCSVNIWKIDPLMKNSHHRKVYCYGFNDQHGFEDDIPQEPQEPHGLVHIGYKPELEVFLSKAACLQSLGSSQSE